jgi:hypothetical protein
MASLHRQPGKPNWFCAYTVEGARRFRSTKTSDKKQAWQVCNSWAKASALGGKLTPERAREVIAAGVADVLMATGQTMPTATIRAWFKRWLEFKEVENEQRTHERYEVSIRRFLNYIGSKADADLTSLKADDVIRFRDHNWIGLLLSIDHGAILLDALINEPCRTQREPNRFAHFSAVKPDFSVSEHHGAVACLKARFAKKMAVSDKLKQDGIIPQRALDVCHRGTRPPPQLTQRCYITSQLLLQGIDALRQKLLLA